MPAPTDNWDEANPPDSQNPKEGDDRIRETRRQMRERLVNGGHRWESGAPDLDPDAGKHMCGVQGTTGVLDLAYEQDGDIAIVVRDGTDAGGDAEVVLGTGVGGARPYELIVDLLTVANIGNSNTFTGAAATLSGNLIVNGNTTLGNAPGDTITVAGTATFQEPTTFSQGATFNGAVDFNSAGTVDAVFTFSVAPVFVASQTFIGLTTHTDGVANNGPAFGNHTTVSSTPYAVVATDHIILIDSAASFFINLPAASAGRRFLWVKRIQSAGVNSTFIARAGADTIDGLAANLNMNALSGNDISRHTVLLYSDGVSNWSILGRILTP
jgi:hypothetical protein